MRYFLKKITCYIFIPILLCHVLFVIIYQIVSIQVDKKLNEIANNSTILIMGDSQMQKISPDFFNPKACNIASAGEHYFITYSKLQKLVANRNHKIQHIILGVSVQNFAPLFINQFDLNIPEGKGSLRRYLYFFDVFNNEFITPEKILLNKDFFLGVLQGPDWGGHDTFHNKDPDILLIESGLKYIYGRSIDSELKNSYKQQYYLGKIVELCNKENINLVMVSNPVHQYYKSHVDDVYFDDLRNAVNNHSNLMYLNYLKDNIPSIYMNDSNHLNKEGAEIYSKKISAELNGSSTPVND